MSYRSFSFLPNINQNNLFSNRFNEIDKIFSRLTGEKPLSDTPMYNLFQISEQKYELILSVPGYQEKELDISVHNSQLIIQGKKENQKKDDQSKTKKCLNKSITFNDFSLNFNFDHKVQVKKADLSLGLLTINFECKIPDEEKPKKIFINIPNNTTEIEKK